MKRKNPDAIVLSCRVAEKLLKYTFSYQSWSIYTKIQIWVILNIYIFLFQCNPNFQISKYCKKLLPRYSKLPIIWSNRMLTEYYVHLATLKLIVFSALIQKGEDLEAHWLTAQSSNLWRMAGPFNFRAMHCYPNHIQRAPTIKKFKKCTPICTLEFE